ncbi:MAG: fumarylacetoacetate hydrolase family protein [Cytophagaceae bacterium]|nr:MAG: fumarylacetoacetate hydrolase family protein [Cytophagaceae bacterium]
MKLVTFSPPSGGARAGWLTPDGQGVVDMRQVSQGALPADMLSFIEQHETLLPLLQQQGWHTAPATYALAAVTLLAPLPNPRSFRDYVSFEQHLLNAAAQFGHQVAAEWYEMPIFYFTNHQAIIGPGAAVRRPAGETRLDYELELACVLGRGGTNLSAAQAEDCIFGYTIFNDFSARAIQGREMRCHLGPAKGKDFANALGPYLVTKDEVEAFRDETGRLSLGMRSRINGQPICDGNFNTIHYSFGQMLAKASENDVPLHPGDVFGSGTVGWGSLVETGFQAHRALEPGDVVELEIDGLGVLSNSII